MIPISRWQHEDGSIVEFSTAGWKSEDAAKTRWLTQMSDLTSSSPVISPLIRMWLEEYCRPIELPGPTEDVCSTDDHNMSETGVDDIAFQPARDREHFKPGAMRPSSEFPTPVRFAFPDTSE
jgi:hypothetical protein